MESPVENIECGFVMTAFIRGETNVSDINVVGDDAVPTEDLKLDVGDMN